MLLGDLTYEICRVSEKAARIARAIRSEETLFSLLVEEKTGNQKNQRFTQDFKTLADVLVQETVKHDLGHKFPGLEKFIFGEESNTFTNGYGDCITVEVQATEAQTCVLLNKVLDNHKDAACLLAKEVHREVVMEMEPALKTFEQEIALEDAGIWIDPIDSTAQYISGRDDIIAVDGVYPEGLQCVVTLIGAFDRTNGLPIVGITNQPFAYRDAGSDIWRGRLVWGISYDKHTLNNVTLPEPSSTAETIVISSSEDQVLKDKLLAAGDFKLLFAAGAGYKMLCVIDGLVVAYVLSRGSTYKWDTCSPHAILQSQGGGLVDLRKALDLVRHHNNRSNEDLASVIHASSQVKYNNPDSSSLPPNEMWSNSGGILAYNNKQALISVLRKLF